MTNSAELQRVFDRQTAHKRELALSTAAQRAEKLARLRDGILAHAEAIKLALHQDLGKPMSDELPMEVGLVLGDIEDAIAHLEEWMKPAPVALGSAAAGSRAYIQYEPRGQVLILAAWNFPFSLAISPLVAALAAGNTAVVKTNEMAPATAEVIGRLIGATFAEEEVAAFTGDVQEAVALQALPFDHVFFTGSPEVGKAVMTAAARNLASVTLELGGKCPAVIDERCNLEAAQNFVAMGRMFNLGQTCLCIDYAVVPESLCERFVDGVAAAIRQHFYDGDSYRKERNSRMVDRRNFQRVKGYIDDAVARGARIAFGGGTDEENLIIEPTILTNVAPDALIMKHEIFGPVLPVLTYRDRDEAVSIVNTRQKPLGMYIYSEDETFIRDLLARTSSGGVTINGWANHYFEPGLPFGGVNHSGQGSYHGVHGFRELSHARSVYAV